MVDRPGQFDAVLRQQPCSVHRAGVVDEHIQLWITGQHLGGQSVHRGLRREVGDECRHSAPLPAAALMRADAMRILVLLRPTMARFAPRAASASAAANPMPVVAPVIRICLSFTAQQSKALATRGWSARSYSTAGEGTRSTFRCYRERGTRTVRVHAQ